MYINYFLLAILISILISLPSLIIGLFQYAMVPKKKTRQIEIQFLVETFNGIGFYVLPLYIDQMYNHHTTIVRSGFAFLFISFEIKTSYDNRSEHNLFDKINLLGEKQSTIKISRSFRHSK